MIQIVILLFRDALKVSYHQQPVLNVIPHPYIRHIAERTAMQFIINVNLSNVTSVRSIHPHP